MTLSHVRQGYLAGRRRMAMTRPMVWATQTMADIESGMRMAAIFHAYNSITPDWPAGSDGWPPDLLRRWIAICLDDRRSDLLARWPEVAV